jgi:hypothetical protein
VPVVGGLLKVAWEADEDPDSYAVEILDAANPGDPAIATGVPDPSDREIDLGVAPEFNGFTLLGVVYTVPATTPGESNTLAIP